MGGVEPLDLVELDLGVLGLTRGPADDPPISAGQARGQIGASPCVVVLLRPASLSGDFAVGRLPEPDRIRVTAEHNGVVPAPYHHGGGTRCLSDGYQVTWQYPLPPRCRELRCVADGDDLTPGQDLARILLGTEHDAAVQPWGKEGTCSRCDHPSSMSLASDEGLRRGRVIRR